MAVKYLPIYILRSRCLVCENLDFARTFVLKDNEIPDEAFTQMESWATKRWPKDHPDCVHEPIFDRIIDEDYRYNIKTKKVVRK